MAQKFLTDIEVTRGLVDSSGDLGVAGQVLSSTGSGTNWITNEANSTVVYLDEFTGDNSTVDFTLSVSVTDENITQVYIDGVYQNKDTYSVSGTTLTFSTAPPLNADIEVITFSTATTSDDLSAGSVIIPVKNTHTASIAKGEPVYITGNVGASARLEIAPADASNSAKMPAAGLLLQTLAVNEEGYVITGGYLRNITTDTIDGTSTSSNDTVYVKSGGGLTMTKPTGTNLIQNIAKVARSASGSAGSLLVSSILRTNDVPNITNDYFWLGNSSGVATPTEFTSTARGLLSVGAEGAAAGDGNLAYNNSSGVFTYTPPVLGGLSGTTDNITEGSTNLYYTDARSRSSISSGGDLSYNSTTGVMSYTTPTTIASLSNHDTDDLAEGSTNLYYTDTRVGTYLTNNSYATQGYVNTQVSSLVDSAPATLDTLNELAAALGDDPNFATTTATSIGLKAPLASPSFTGNATFAGDILLSHTGSAGQIIRTTNNSEPYFALQRNSGSNGVGVLRLMDGGDLKFDTGATGAGQATRLTIDGSNGNATFSGDVMPAAENAHNIGSAAVRWEDLYVDDGFIRNAYIDEYIYHTGDTDTYIRFTPDTITFREAGADSLVLDSNRNATFEGNVSANRFILPSTGTTTPVNHYIFTNNTNTGTGSLTIQAGGGSAAYGGGLKLYSHSHASKPGWVQAGISSGSGGKFTVNTHGAGTGSDVFMVDANGTTINGVSQGLTFLGGNNRIYFNGHRALEGATDGSTLQIGEGYSTIRIEDTTLIKYLTSANSSTFLTLHNDVGGDLGTQKTFIDFIFEDDNDNDWPQVRIGAEVGQNSNADSQLKEGSGAFVVYTNNASTNNPGNPSNLAERFRVDYLGNVGINASASLRFNGAGDASHSVGYNAGIDGAILRGQNGVILGTGGGATASQRMRINSQGQMWLGGSYTGSDIANGNTSYMNNLNAGSFSILHRNSSDAYVHFNSYYTSSSTYVSKYNGRGFMLGYNAAADTGFFFSKAPNTTAGQIQTFSKIMTVGYGTSNNVGIGENSPADKLDVNGAILCNNRVQIDGVDDVGNVTGSLDSLRATGYGLMGNRTGNIYITNGNSAAGAQIVFGLQAAHNGNNKLVIGNTVSYFNNNKLLVNKVVDDGGQLQVATTNTSGSIRIGGGNGAGNSRVYIDSNGNDSYIDSYGGSTYQNLAIQAAVLKLQTHSSAQSRSVDVGGQVWRGYGSSPIGKINVEVAGGHAINIFNTEENKAYLNFIDTQSDGTQYCNLSFDSGNNYFTINNMGNNAMFITNAGYSKLTNNGNTTWNGYSFHSITNSATNEPTVMVYSHASTGDVYGVNVIHRSANANTSGRFFSGETNAGNNSRIKIYSNGNIQNSNNSYGQLSDINLKENIVDATPKLDEINQVRVVNFNYIDDINEETNAPTKQIGVVAQELEEIFPGLVYECGDTEVPTKSVKYSVFVPILIKAVQELTQEVQTLKDQINGIN